MLDQNSITKEYALEMVQKHGGFLPAGRAICTQYLSPHSRGAHASAKSVAEWLRAAIGHGVRVLPLLEREDASRESRLENLLRRSNVSLEQVDRLENIKIKQWGFGIKDPETGEIVTKTLDATSATIIPAAPAWPLMDRPPAAPIVYRDAPAVLGPSSVERVVVISDTQIGFLVDQETGALEPIHDPRAMRVAEQIVRDVQPSRVVYIGDWLDLSFVSRWQQHNEFDAVNESLEAGYRWLCRFKAAAPRDAKHVMISGNHDIRLEKFLLETNRAAMKIRRPGDTSGWPVFSLPYLMRFEELGIETPGYFPGGEYFVTSDLVAMHAPPRAGEFQASVIHGHQHKLAMTPRVQHSHGGRLTYMTYDVGCLCRTGSTDNPRRLMRTHVPSDRARTNWVQGIGVFTIDAEREMHAAQLVRIEEGSALFEGRFYSGQDEGPG